MAASDGPVTTNLPSSVAPYTFFMRKVSFDRILQRPLLVSLSSPLIFDASTLCELCEGLCVTLSSTPFSSVNIETYIVQRIRKLLNQIEARKTKYSSLETTSVLSLPRKRIDTRTSSEDQWHESQWQQGRWLTEIKGTNVVKVWSHHETTLIKSSIEHKHYHHQTPAPTTTGSDLDYVQPRGHHAGALSQRCQASGNNYVTTPCPPPNVHQFPRQSRHLSFWKPPESFRHHLQTDKKWATDLSENLQCKKESN